MYLIGVIIAAMAAVLFILGQSQSNMNLAEQDSRVRMVDATAKEFGQFSTAAMEYINSIGLPLPGTALTVSDMQQNNLLPSSFPATTPFGQSLVADYVTDPQNTQVLDVVIHTTGPLVAADMNRAGFSGGNPSYFVSSLQYEVAQAVQSSGTLPTPSQIPGSTGQFFGIGNQSTLTTLGSSATQALPGVTLSQPEVGFFVQSPGQYGYWLISINEYGWGVFWQPVNIYGVLGSTPENTTYSFGISWGPVTPSITSQGFSLSCPGSNVAYNASNLTSGQSNQVNQTVFSTGPNLSTNQIICLPAYKGQVTPINMPLLTDNLSDPSASDLVYFTGGQLNWTGNYFQATNSNSSGQDAVSNNYTFIQPQQINGLNDNLYDTGGYFSIYSDLPQYPSNESAPFPNPNFITAAGAAFQLKTPSGATNTYQIEMDGGQLFTGGGCTQALVSPWSLGYQSYQVWGTSNNGSENLCGSQITDWRAWGVVMNSGNSSYFGRSQAYEYAGNTYNFTFSVPTPMVN